MHKAQQKSPPGKSLDGAEALNSAYLDKMEASLNKISEPEE